MPKSYLDPKTPSVGKKKSRQANSDMQGSMNKKNRIKKQQSKEIAASDFLSLGNKSKSVAIKHEMDSDGKFNLPPI